MRGPSSTLRIALLFVLTLSLAQKTNADTNFDRLDSPYRFSAAYGISPFGNGLTFELQKDHHVFGVSFSTYTYKYEFAPSDHGWFLGGYHTHKVIYGNAEQPDHLFDLFTDVVEEAILYRYRRFGLGGGYSWKWKSGFRLSLSSAIGLGNYEGNFDDPKYPRVTAGVNFGYQF